jgi:SAM-dependent methyltransferase
LVEAFDLVLSVGMIHHVGDRVAYLREACRVLAPGGRTCTVTDSEEIIPTRRLPADYFPVTLEAELQRDPRLHDLKAGM